MDAGLPAAAAQPWMTMTVSAEDNRQNGEHRLTVSQSRAADMILKQDSKLTMVRALNPAATLSVAYVRFTHLLCKYEPVYQYRHVLVDSHGNGNVNGLMGMGSNENSTFSHVPSTSTGTCSAGR